MERCGPVVRWGDENHPGQITALWEEGCYKAFERKIPGPLARLWGERVTGMALAS